MSSQPYLSCKIQGGLGNQLFQIFFAFASAIRLNRKVVFQYEEVIGNRHTYWNTFLKGFSLFTSKQNTITNEEIAKFAVVNEKGFGYQPNIVPECITQDIMMFGYFQSHKYFQEYQTQLYSILQLTKLQTAIKEKYSELFSYPTTISMHFRLGDYKQKRYYHPIVNYEYYESCLTYIVEHIPETKDNLRVIYFCEEEDNVYVESKIALLLQKYPEISFIKANDTMEDWEQLMVMSCCNHNIIANSTFSWWGAYFNQHPDKMVCYPSKWFGDYYEHSHDQKDLFPDEWIKQTVTYQKWNEPLK